MMKMNIDNQFYDDYLQLGQVVNCHLKNDGVFTNIDHYWILSEYQLDH